MPAISHFKSNTGADFTGTVTVFNSQGSTATIAATDLVRPVDWNSIHNQAWSISGNTAGDASAGNATNIVFGGSNNVTISASTGVSAVTLWVKDFPEVTALSYQNRQIDASSTTSAGQNSLWLAPFRLTSPVSASSLLQLMSFSGTITSSATAQAGMTIRWALYTQNATDANRFDTLWQSSLGFTFWNSGTSSYSYSYNGGNSNSAGSNLATASVMGLRMLTVPINSILNDGLYLFGMVMSTSSAGYSAAMSRMVPVFDAPVPTLMGYMGSATNASLAFVDGGTWTSATTGAIPNSVSIGHIGGVSNFMPWFKVGAI